MPVSETGIVGRLKPRRGNCFALFGLLFGFIGLAVAAYRMSVESETPPRPRAKEVLEILSDTVKKAADKFRKKPTPAAPAAVPTEWSVSRKLGLASTACGFAGAVLGCISWLVGEHRRWTWAALAVGVAAMAWAHVVVAVAISIAIAISIWLLAYLG